MQEEDDVATDNGFKAHYNATLHVVNRSIHKNKLSEKNAKYALESSMPVGEENSEYCSQYWLESTLGQAKTKITMKRKYDADDEYIQDKNNTCVIFCALNDRFVSRKLARIDLTQEQNDDHVLMIKNGNIHCAYLHSEKTQSLCKIPVKNHLSIDDLDVRNNYISEVKSVYALNI